MKCIYIIGIFLVWTNISFGQYKKGVKYLDKGEYDKALAAFEADLEDKDTKPVAEYWLVKLFSDKNYEEVDLQKAHDYALSAQKSLRKTSSNVRKKIQKEGVSNAALRKMQRNLTNRLFDKVVTNNEVDGYNNFLEKCKMASAPQIETASKNRNEKALSDAQQKNTFEEYKAFIEKYHENAQKLNPDLAIEAEKLLFESYIKKNSWTMYFNFREIYPQNIYSLDSAGGFDMVKIVRKKELSVFKAYQKAHPISPFMKFAKDNMFDIIMAGKDTREYDYFVRNFPDYERNDELWPVFYKLYIQDNGQKGVVEFYEEYPDYPDQVQLTKDLRAYEKTVETPIFEKTKNSNKTKDYMAFVDRYPHSEFIPQLEKPMYEALINDGTYKGCQWFMDHYPNSEYRQKVLKVLYQHYAADGELSSLDKFYQKYPYYGDGEQLKKDMKIAEQGANLNLMKPFELSKTKDYEDYIREAAPKELAFVALQRMIAEDIKEQKWGVAKAKVERYGAWFGEKHPKIEGLLGILDAKDQDIIHDCLSSKVNSELEEYVPIISMDDQYLYFCRWDLTNENIYVSEFDGKEWGTAYPLEELNTPTKNEGPMAVSADNSEMIIFVEGDLYYSTKTNEGWQAPEPYPSPINSESWDADAMLSSDGRAMVFVSRRKEVLDMYHEKWAAYHGDGFGNIDIFVSLKNENGKWQKPINLGEQINTPYAERTPFLHPDMKTLYFSSDGHGGVGKMDVYKTTRLDDTWMNWTEPVNLGKNINTTENDWGYKISTDGKMAYFAVKNDKDANKASQDICTIELPEWLRPGKVSTISGHLTDTDGQAIEAEIVWEDLQTGEIVGRLKSNPKTGEFFIALPNDRQYSYFVSKDGFFPKANNIDLRDKGERIDVDERLEMVRIEEMVENDIALPLKNLFFETSKFDIQSASFLELGRLAKLVQDYDLVVEISGHTDDRGSDADNKTLSQNRANEVKSYLVKQGCNVANIQAVGYGETKPIQSNKTEEGRAQNRRVEVRFKKKN